MVVGDVAGYEVQTDKLVVDQANKTGVCKWLE